MNENQELSYDQQGAWRKLMDLLPERLRLDADEMPSEETWKWRDHYVHLDRYDVPGARSKIILQHGVGTNGRQMTLLIGQRLARAGYAVIALDSPGYGMTRVGRSLVRFDDWVDLLSDLIDRERERDEMPVFLFGLSAGGMLCVHAAGKNRKVKGIVGLTFLDERIYRLRHETVIHPLIAPFVPLVVMLGRIPGLRRLRVPMKLVSKMHTLSNDRALLRVFLRDRSSAGSRVTLAFLSSFMAYRPAVEARDFDICPVLLAQPQKDRWTPERLSHLSLAGIRSSFSVRQLENAGHYPTEEPGLSQLEEYLIQFIESNQNVAAGSSARRGR